MAYSQGGPGYDFARREVLELRAFSGHDIFPTDLGAPRLLRQVSGDLALETDLVDIEAEQCQIGGLLLWVSGDMYLSFAKRFSQTNEMRLEACRQGRWEIIGRGWMPGSQIRLRLERKGGSVLALCSNDGREWKSCGEASFPTNDPIWVGFYAACPVGHPSCSLRFREFRVFKRGVE